MNYRSILGKIKDRNITLEEITRMDLDSKTKAILLYAYYEVNKMSYELKQLLNQAFWLENEEMLLVKKRLLGRSKQNSKFFDMGFFNDLIIGKVRSQKETRKVVVEDKTFYGRDVGIHGNVLVQDHQPKTISVDDLVKEITRLKDADKFEEALDLCENGPYADNTNVLVQRVDLLKELERFEEALDICEQPNLASKLPFIHARIKILKMLERYEEALTLCEMPRWQNNIMMVVQRVYILIALDRLDEALDITQESQYEDVRKFSRVVAKIITTKMEIEEAIAEVESTTNSLDYDRWTTLVGKVDYLISRHMGIRSLIGYLDFLLLVDVKCERKQVVSYVCEVARLRELRDSLTNRVRKSTNEEPDSSGGAKHKLNLAFKNDLC